MKKKELFSSHWWHVFSVASFLFITIFFVLPYLVQISTYFHEKAHMNALSSFGVDSSYELHLIRTIPAFFDPHVDALGVTRFNVEEYAALDKWKRTEINRAGIVSDLWFLFYIGGLLALVNVCVFVRVYFFQKRTLTWILALNWILFMWLLALTQITLANITHTAGDIGQLVMFLKV